MNQVLYDLGIFLYSKALRIIAPFNTKAKAFVDGRKNIFARLEHAMDAEERPVAWFHCASLGEFEQGRPVMEAFREEYGSNYAILLTFFSPSGYEVRKDYTGADHVFYLPMDTADNALRFLQITKPRIVFFVKYEFWHHYLHSASMLDIPLVCFSAIFRHGQVFFKSYGQFYRRILSYFDHIFVQDKQSKQLLKTIGMNNVSIAGDTRFDRVAAIVTQAKEISVAERFKDERPLLVVGSCWAEDLEALLPLFDDENLAFKCIIAPHEPKSTEIRWLQERLKRPSVKYSEAAMADLSKFDFLIIDNIGMLSSLYRYGDLAYVGGAFGKGLHNILEPATFGQPVLFGPDHAKFREAKQLIKYGGAFSITTASELYQKTSELLNDHEKRTEAGDKARQYVKENQGATDKVIAYCKDNLKVTL